MNSAEYWKKREAANLASNLKDEKAYKKELDRIYKDMLDGCQKEIDSFYGRYADAEGISIAEARKRVSKLDIVAYERKAEKYVKAAEADRRQNGGKTNTRGYYFSATANEEMKLYNLTMKVNRLEMLKANIGLELIKGHAEMETFMEKILRGRTEDELKRQAGILGKSVRNNAKLANSIVNGSHHNASFSQRLWANQSEMKADLSKMLENGMIQGKNARKLAKELRTYFIGDERLKNGKKGKNYATERLMVTELARVQTEAQKQSFIANGFDEYIFIVNGGCCDICAGIAGKNFKVEKMRPGENAPPMHSWCRCSIAAYEDSEEYESWLNYLETGGTTAEWDKLSAKEKASYNGKTKPNAAKKKSTAPQEFTPAESLKEATNRVADALGAGKVSLGRMPLELANQYLEGIERFMSDFPMLKGYYSNVGTKTGAPGVMGLNKLTGEYVDNRSKLKLSCDLNLKSTSNLDKMLSDYAAHAKRGGSYIGESPLSTAVHELVHGIDHATAFKEYGGYDENGLGTIAAKDWNAAKGGVSRDIIKQVREEMFGAQFGKEVAEKTRYLGSYARTSSKEELAEAISYEYVNESNPYSARILELFKEKVKEVF